MESHYTVKFERWQNIYITKCMVGPTIFQYMALKVKIIQKLREIVT